MKNKKKKKSLFEKISTLSFLTLIPFVIFLIYVLTSVFRETNDEVELPKIMIKDIKNVRIAIDEYYRATGTFPNLVQCLQLQVIRIYLKQIKLQ